MAIIVVPLELAGVFGVRDVLRVVLQNIDQV